MVKISTSLFTIEKKDLPRAVKAASNTDYFHIDVTDGIFVKDAKGGASLFFDETHIQTVRDNSSIPLDVHLMIAEPIKHIQRYARFKPEFISFHFEAAPDPDAVIKKIRSYGVKPAIVLNPDTPLSRIKEYVNSVDMVLLMSVVPGKGGQGYIPKVTGRIRQLRKMIDEQGLDTLIEVDGGIKLDNICLPINAGADVIVSGTGIYNPKEEYKDLTPEEVIEKMKQVVYIGADHGGYALKEKIVKYFEEKGIAYKDLSHGFDPKDDYPDIAKEVGKRVVKEDGKGILICGTGTGMNIAANKVHGVRAASLADEDKVLLARLHNDLNVLCLSGLEFINLREQVVGKKYENLLDIKTKEYSLNKAVSLIEVFLNTPFEGGRHQRRVDKLDKTAPY